MSVTTSAQMNVKDLQAALVALAPGSGFVSRGADLPTTNSKTITAIGATDAQLTSAITTASGEFVDLVANQAAILANVKNRQATIQTWMANNPSGAVLTAAQTLTLAQMLNGLCNLLLNEFSSTTGT